MANVSEVSICNQALGWLGGNHITSLLDSSTEGILCNANYATLRDTVLEASDWSFAMLRGVTGAPVLTPPAWGYANAFTLPAAMMRMIYVGQSARVEEDDPVPDWVMEGGMLLMNNSVGYFRGIQRITDPLKFTTLFSQALAARLAMDIAIPIAHSRTLQADMGKLYGMKMAEAASMDAKQGRMRVIRAPGMNQARRAGATGVIGPTV